VLYRLTIAYVGTAFGGWQRQPNAPTVQQVVEEALARVAGAAVDVVGASRTDAGVHAEGQVAHLRLARALPPHALVFGGNSLLPDDVRILGASEAPSEFHAQRASAGKEYRYRIHGAPVVSPFARPFVWPHAGPLDRGAMAAATQSLVGRHDFAAFALAGGSHRASGREIYAAEWSAEGAELVLRIVGDGFLRGMVRSIVGTLVEVGRGRRTPESFAALLAGAPRSAAGETAPASGLCLVRVFYPEPLGGPPRV